MREYQFTRILIGKCRELGVDSAVMYDYLAHIIQHPILEASIKRYVTGSTEEVRYENGKFV